MAEELTRLEGSMHCMGFFWDSLARMGNTCIQSLTRRKGLKKSQLCKQILKYSGNTTNVRFRSESHHCKEVKEAEQAAPPSTTSRMSVKSSSTTKYNM